MSPLRPEKLKALVKGAFASAGLVIQREPRSADRSHTRVTPSATYSPWNVDRDFQAVYDRIRHHTLVDIYRCHELWNLVAQSAKLGEGALIEIGVWRGGTGTLIASRAREAGIHETVYLCDTFSGIVKAGGHDPSYIGGEHRDTSRETVAALLEQAGLDNVRILQGTFPEDTGHAVEAERFRFCHIDVDVYDSARDILGWIWDRMVPGGIVVYDDYGAYSTAGVARHVNEQMHLADRIVLHNLNGHAVVIKR